MLALQFNRSRFLLLSLVTACTYWLIQSRLQVSLGEASAAGVYNALAVSLPLILLFLLAVPERGIWNLFGPAYLGAVMGLAATGYLLSVLLPAWISGHPEWWSLWPGKSYVLPVASSFLHALGLLAGIGVLCWRNTETEAALLGMSLGTTLLLILVRGDNTR